MFDFHEKRKIRNWVFSKPAVLLVLVASFLLGTSVLERYEKERETAAKYHERAAELAELEARAAALEAKVSYIESERGIEAEIRDRYNAVKEGEQVVVILDREEPRASTTPESAAESPREGFFSRLMFWR